MKEKSAGVTGIIIFIAIFIFVGWWFGLSTILWVIGAVVVMLIGAGLSRQL